MTKQEFEAIISDLRLKLPEVNKYKFIYSFKNNAIHIQGKGGFEEVIELDHKPRARLLEDLMEKMKVLLHIYRSKTLV